MTYLLGVMAVVTALVGGYGYWMKTQNETLILEKASVQGKLFTCGARLDNLIEDVRSDNEVDNIPDSALRNVPSDWLFDPDAPGGN